MKGSEICMNDSKKHHGPVDAAAVVICCAAIAAAIYFAGRYVLGFLLPFLLAYAVAAAAVPPARRLSARLHLPFRLVAALCVLFILAAAATLSALAINRGIFEIKKLLSQLSDERSRTLGDMLCSAIELIDSRISDIPLIRSLREAEELSGFLSGLDSAMGNAVGELISKLTSELPALIASVIKALPSVLLSFAVTVISGFYFALDRDRLARSISSLLPSALRTRLPEIKRLMGKTVAGYIKAYLIILLITFCELFIGLSILGADYAFLLATVMAAIDILPVLGVGTILLPWSLVSFICRDTRMGVGLLILYAVIEAVRQFIEPRLVGNTLGIHPLAALAAMYAGFELFGIGGMLIGPLLALAARVVISTVRDMRE